MVKVFSKFLMIIFISSTVLFAQNWSTTRHVDEVEVRTCNIGGQDKTVVLVGWENGTIEHYFIVNGEPITDYWFKMLVDGYAFNSEKTYKQLQYIQKDAADNICGGSYRQILALRVTGYPNPFSN